MLTIQRLTPHPRKPDRVSVHLPGEGGLALSLADLRRLGLREGLEVSPALREQIDAAARGLEVLDRATAMLARRPRATRDLRQRLLRGGAAAADVDRALALLQARGALDDAAFALYYARCKLAGGGRSTTRVRGELVRQGIAGEQAARAVQEAARAEGVDEGATLQALIARRLPSLRALDPAVRRRRLFAFLLRRGFKTAEVLTALRRALEGP